MALYKYIVAKLKTDYEQAGYDRLVLVSVLKIQDLFQSHRPSWPFWDSKHGPRITPLCARVFKMNDNSSDSFSRETS